MQKGGLTTRQSDGRLKGTVSSQKNEILFSEFGVNYNNEPQQFRKGSVIYKKKVEIPVDGEEKTDEQNGEDVSKYRWESQGGDKRQDGRQAKYARPDTKVRQRLFEEACDIIGDTFWEANPHLLGPYSES